MFFHGKGVLPLGVTVRGKLHCMPDVNIAIFPITEWRGAGALVNVDYGYCHCFTQIAQRVFAFRYCFLRLQLFQLRLRGVGQTYRQYTLLSHLL